MKIFIIVLLLIIPTVSMAASNCTVTCPSKSLNIIEQEKFINKITGLNFVSKKFAEMVIEKELRDELKSSFNANLEIYTIKRLKKGEFKSLTIKSNKIKYKAVSLSDFYAQTVCPYNQIIYTKKKIYYPYDLSFKFKAEITNQDIQNTLNSVEFQKELEKNSIKINGMKTFRIKTPKVEIKEGKIHFSIPIETFLSSKPFYINLIADLYVQNNKLVLKNIIFSSNSNIINIDILSGLINKINPAAFQLNSINSKYCKIYITGAKISKNSIITEGTFLINKNYER